MDQPLLSKPHLQSVNKALASLNRAVQIADKLEAIGGDVTDHRLQIEYLRQRLGQVKQQFFPGAQ